MIARQRQHLKPRHLAVLLVITEVGEPQVETLKIGECLNGIRAKIGRVYVSLQTRGCGPDAPRCGALDAGEFPVTLICKTRFGTQIPKEAAGRKGRNIVVQTGTVSAAAGIHGRPELLN